jgi:autotransporter-associated beta strand protein
VITRVKYALALLFTTGSITTSRATTLNAVGGSINTNGFDSTFFGVFSGTGSLTKLGTGTLTLSETNTYTGDTIFNVGIISVGAGSNLGNTANSLIFGGGTLQTSAGLATARAATLNAGGGTIDTNGFNSTFSGVFSGQAR